MLSSLVENQLAPLNLKSWPPRHFDRVYKHLIDLSLHNRLKKSNIIRLTDTQLTQNLDIPDIAALQEYEIVNYSNQDRFQSIAVCKTLNTFITSHTKQGAASFMTVWKSSFDNKRIKLLLRYRKHALSLSNLCDWLQSCFFSRYYFR